MSRESARPGGAGRGGAALLSDLSALWLQRSRLRCSSSVVVVCCCSCCCSSFSTLVLALSSTRVRQVSGSSDISTIITSSLPIPLALECQVVEVSHSLRFAVLFSTVVGRRTRYCTGTALPDSSAAARVRRSKIAWHGMEWHYPLDDPVCAWTIVLRSLSRESTWRALVGVGRIDEGCDSRVGFRVL